jgi:SAM-dependent methyltransferase
MSEPVDFAYVGGELGLFARATNWKAYWSSFLRELLRGEVLEVGAGLGVNTVLLADSQAQHWVCLEPDAALLDQTRAAVAAVHGRNRYEFVQGTVADLDGAARFDAVLYIDVLEHIPDDAGELQRAAARLKPGGRLVVLSPAHPWLFTPFDAAIGHHRRYTRRMLRDAGPPGLRLERLRYLDACGLLASLGNRLLLRQSMPTLRQILFWDRVLVPASRVLDRLLCGSLGKSVLGIWARPGGENSEN